MTSEKLPEETETSLQEPSYSHDPEMPMADEEPKRWYNTGLKIGKYQLKPYNHGFVQMIMVSFVCFLCPGMFNSLNGIGGNGLPDGYASVGANSNVALYSCFATVGFFAGTVVNKIGVKWTMACSGLGYAIYSSAFLCFSHTYNKGFVIAAGAILGICAGLLWAAQGVVVMSYATEQEKGRYVTIFWAIFNVGAVIGALIPLGQDVNNTGTNGVTDGTYAGFLALMIVGAMLAFLLLPTELVRKSDGTKVIVKEHPTWISELKAMYQALLSTPQIALLFPMFFASNWFYTYQFNEFNAPLFNVRTRALNSLLYWAAQIIGALTWGVALDWEFASRKTRARIFHITLFVLTMAIWGGGYKVMKRATREEYVNNEIKVWDWTDRGYIGPMFLYIFYGLYDAVWQTYCYWLMGALSNSSRKLAIYAGYYKGLQSAGAAVVWRLDAMGLPFLNIFASTWALCAGGLVFAAPMVWTSITETTDLESDAQFTDNIHADELARRIGAVPPSKVAEAAEGVAVA